MTRLAFWSAVACALLLAVTRWWPLAIPLAWAAWQALAADGDEWDAIAERERRDAALAQDRTL